jgi:predicted MFS family arabinose efflux permease
VGDLVGPLLLATALWSGLGWRAAFWAAGVMMVAYGVLLATRPLPRPAPDAEESALGALMSVIRDRRVIMAGLLVAVIVAFDDTFIGFAVAFLITDQGLSPALATVATGAGLTGGVVAAAWASRTNGRRIGLRTCAVALAAGVFLLILFPTTWTAAVAMALVGAAVNLAWIILQARYMTLRPGQAGATSSVAEAVAQIGVTTPLIIGLLADHTGLGPAMWLYCAVALVFVVSAR